MTKCLESRGFLSCLWVGYFSRAPVSQYLCVFLNCIIIKLCLTIAPVQTLVLV